MRCGRILEKIGSTSLLKILPSSLRACFQNRCKAGKKGWVLRKDAHVTGSYGVAFECQGERGKPRRAGGIRGDERSPHCSTQYHHHTLLILHHQSLSETVQSDVHDRSDGTEQPQRRSSGKRPAPRGPSSNLSADALMCALCTS